MIESYATGYVVVNQQRIASSLVVTPRRLLREWPPGRVQELTAKHLQTVLTVEPEVILLGTGETLEFPRPEQIRPLVESTVGFEVMDTAAACRTYNVLFSEGRNVAAALMLSG